MSAAVARRSKPNDHVHLSDVGSTWWRVEHRDIGSRALIVGFQTQSTWAQSTWAQSPRYFAVLPGVPDFTLCEEVEDGLRAGHYATVLYKARAGDVLDVQVPFDGVYRMTGVAGLIAAVRTPGTQHLGLLTPAQTEALPELLRDLLDAGVVEGCGLPVRIEDDPAAAVVA